MKSSGAKGSGIVPDPNAFAGGEYMNKNCTFSKTYTGTCDQRSVDSSEYCYYHNKVISGLIESDPILSMRNATKSR